MADNEPQIETPTEDVDMAADEEKEELEAENGIETIEVDEVEPRVTFLEWV
jgi:hypothetical protein